MVFKAVNGPGKFDLMTAAFDGKPAAFQYQEGNRRKKLIICVNGLFSCTEDKGRTRWMITGWDVNEYEDKYFLVYDSKKRQGLVVPFLKDKSTVGMNQQQLNWITEMRDMFWELPLLREPMSKENLSSLRFRMLVSLTWLTGVRMDADEATLLEWRD